MIFFINHINSVLQQFLLQVVIICNHYLVNHIKILE